MHEFTKDAHPNIELIRARLRKMSDQDLVRFGKDARYMCSPKANMGKPPLESFLVQLEEARAEFRRRRLAARDLQKRAVESVHLSD